MCLKSLLELKALSCDTAQSGNSAIELIKSRIELARADKKIPMYKLILLDYSLGDGFDGPDVASTLRDIIEDAPGI